MIKNYTYIYVLCKPTSPTDWSYIYALQDYIQLKIPTPLEFDPELLQTCIDPVS